FMTVATLIWQVKPFNFPQTSLGLPLAIYVSNFAFATIMSVAAGIYIPVLLGLIVGLIPVLILYRLANSQTEAIMSENMVNVSVNPVGVLSK
ncbi:MAG: carotenoid biosynthesis protein, partial [Crocosphaera sp.]